MKSAFISLYTMQWKCRGPLHLRRVLRVEWY